MANSLGVQIADGVVAALNADVLREKATAKRTWIDTTAREDETDLRCLVWLGASEQESNAEDSEQDTITVNVSLRAPLEPEAELSADAQIDVVDALRAEIAAALLGTIHAATNASCTAVRTDGIDTEILRSEQLVAIDLETTWTLYP